MTERYKCTIVLEDSEDGDTVTVSLSTTPQLKVGDPIPKSGALHAAQQAVDSIASLSDAAS